MRNIEERELPLVSIVSPSFNQAEFLEFTIQSVLNQDYPRIEYIIVDGGSTDGSVEIIKKYQDKLKWWVSEPDEGQGNAIQKGFEKASGDIIGWLNSDDLLISGSISSAVNALNINPESGFVFGNGLSIDEKGRPINPFIFSDWGLTELISFRIICQPAVFIRKSAYDAIGGISTDYDYLLDHHLWLRIASAYPIKHISEYWAAARQHPSAKNVKHAKYFSKEAHKLLVWMENEDRYNSAFEENKRNIVAGVYRLSARYLLDGGEYKSAIREYWQSFMRNPIYTLKHSTRIIYAFLHLIKLGRIADWLVKRMQYSKIDNSFAQEIFVTPGIVLD